MNGNDWKTNADDPRCDGVALTVILVAAVAIRVALIVGADIQPARFDFPDARRYATVARNIAAGLGPVDSAEVRSGTDPLYPLLLSLGIRLGLERDEQLFRFGRLLNTLCSLISVVLVAKIGRVLRSRRIGLIAAAFFALDPITVFFNAVALTETCYTTLLLGSVWLISEQCSTRIPIHWCAVAGVLAGFGAITRSSSILLPVALALWLVTVSSRKRWPAAAVFLVAAFAMITPTLARNYRLFGRIVPVRTGAGASLMEALGPWADGGPGMDRIVPPAFPPDADEVERDARCRSAAWAWTVENPLPALRLAWIKLGRTWSITLNARDYSSPATNAVCWITVAPIFAAALWGAWLLRSRRSALILLLIPIAYFTMVHMVFVGSVRYRQPVMPLVFVLAAVGVDAVVGAFRKARENRVRSPHADAGRG